MDEQCHLAVIGAGATGLACAISSARTGARVFLIEKSSALGGTVAHSLIHTIGGLYDSTGKYLNSGLAVETAELLLNASPHTTKRRMGRLWTLSVDPATYLEVIEHWIARHPSISVMRNTLPIAVRDEFASGGRRKIKAIEVLGETGRSTIKAQAIVDATGNAAVVRMAGSGLVSSGTALAGLIFQIQGAEPGCLDFPKNVAVRRTLQKSVEAGVLPGIFANTWLDAGVYPGEIYAKANFCIGDFDATAVPNWEAALLKVIRALPDFRQSVITRTGALGVRDGGSIEGEYRLTLDDVKRGRRFEDSVGSCAWPVEYWDPEKGVLLDHLPDGQSYDIPLRALKVAGFINLWAAGKCLSAEKMAQASARVAGTCWAMGDGLGAAICRRLDA